MNTVGCREGDLLKLGVDEGTVEGTGDGAIDAEGRPLGTKLGEGVGA